MKRAKTEEKSKNGLSKRYIIVSSLTLLVSGFMLIMATIAWFTGTSINGNSATVVVDTEGMDLDAKLYIGNDMDRDGTLDGEISEDNPLLQYTEFNIDDTNVENACLPGTRISYRLVIYNPNSRNVGVNVNFSPLDGYFQDTYEKLEVDDNGIITSFNNSDLAGLDTVLGENSARIMFKVSNMRAIEYVKNSQADPASTDLSDFTKGDTVEISPTELRLWEISAQEEFVKDCEVAGNSYLIIDYVLECMQLDEIVDGYTLHCENYITENSIDQQTQKKIRALYNKELEYVTDINITDEGDDGTAISRKMMFTIAYVSVKGVEK